MFPVTQQVSLTPGCSKKAYLHPSPRQRLVNVLQEPPSFIHTSVGPLIFTFVSLTIGPGFREELEDFYCPFTQNPETLEVQPSSTSNSILRMLKVQQELSDGHPLPKVTLKQWMFPGSSPVYTSPRRLSRTFLQEQ